MTEIDNVIKTLETCVSDADCGSCPYQKHTACRHFLMRDALKLLKQEKQIIHCKDCRWFSMPRFGERGYCNCFDMTSETTFYCAEAERR